MANINNSIKLGSGFLLKGAPVDLKLTAATIAERNSYVTENALYKGAMVYVEETDLFYVYTGVASAGDDFSPCWKELLGEVATDSNVVKVSGDQTIEGVKTFVSAPKVGTETVTTVEAVAGIKSELEGLIGEKQDAFEFGASDTIEFAEEEGKVVAKLLAEYDAKGDAAAAQAAAEATAAGALAAAKTELEGKIAEKQNILSVESSETVALDLTGDKLTARLVKEYDLAGAAATAKSEAIAAAASDAAGKVAAAKSELEGKIAEKQDAFEFGDSETVGFEEVDGKVTAKLLKEYDAKGAAATAKSEAIADAEGKLAAAKTELSEGIESNKTAAAAAQGVADNALAKANKGIEDAEAARQAAVAAQGTADKGVADAATAQAAAVAAQGTADSAVAAAGTAQAAAEAAQGTADDAVEAAATAQTQADKGVADAAAALKAAQDAQSTADEGVAAAAAAQTQADKGVADAAAAMAKAEEGVAAAAAAQAKAEEGVAAAAKNAEDLGALAETVGELDEFIKSSSEIDDSKVSTATTYSSEKIVSEINAAKQAVKDDLLDGAGEAYDTLKELGALIDENKDLLDAFEEVAAGHVAFDKDQTATITSDQAAVARANIKAASQAAVEAAQKAADDAAAAAAKAGTDAAGALASAKTELEGKITAAETAAKSAASSALASAKTELEGKITAAESAASGALASAKTELEGKITAAETAAKSAAAEDAASKVAALKKELLEGAIKDNADAADAAQGAAEAAQGTANANAQAIEGLDDRIEALEQANEQVLDVAHGGTGAATLAANQIVLGNGTAAVKSVANAEGVLIGAANAAPEFGKVDVTKHISGVVPVANGGTGASAITANALLVGNSGGTAVTAVANAAGVLVGSANGAPAFGKVDLANVVDGVLPLANGGTGHANADSKVISIGDIKLTTAAGSNVTVPASGTLVTLAGTETLSNKTIAGLSATGTATFAGNVTGSGESKLTGFVIDGGTY